MKTNLQNITEFNKQTRTLALILDIASRRLFPQKVYNLLYELPKTVYSELRTPDKTTEPLTKQEINALENEAKAIMEKALPINLVEVKIKKAYDYLKMYHRTKTLSMCGSIVGDSVLCYKIDDYYGTAIGEVLENTSQVAPFKLMPYANGFCVAFEGHEPKLENMSKIFQLLCEREAWYNMIGLDSVGKLNKNVNSGETPRFITFCEAMHEREYARIADEIKASFPQKRIVFLAGPSSSGKTTSSKRIALQCAVVGLVPKVIELDNYFVDREKTPRDDKGNYNFEALECLDLELLGAQLKALLNGEEVELPRFDFKKGVQLFEGGKMRLKEHDILIMEGIHALNPAMVPSIAPENVLRIFVAPMNSIVFDETNYVSSSDIRMIRRIVRDSKTRGSSPEETIKQWQSVREGEEENIYPYQENADIILNSSLPYELPVLKYYVEPLLKRIPHTSSVKSEVRRLLALLNLISPITPDEMEAIPPQSVMREFIGGQILE